MAVQKLGDVAVETVVKLNEDGSSVNFIVAQHGSPSADYYGFDNVTLLLRQDLTTPTSYNNSSSSNIYADSTGDKWLCDTYLNRLDPDILEALQIVNIPYAAGNVGADIRTGANGLHRKVFLPSDDEINGNSSETVTLGVPFSYFRNADASKRIAKYNGAAYPWWTRNPMSTYVDSSHGGQGAVYVAVNGDTYPRDAVGNHHGMRPVLAIRSDVFVESDGTIVSNYPPTVPASIDVSGVVRGENATITLTAATDPDGTVESYIYERQVDGGAWQQVAQANSLTQTDTIGEDWGTIAYRACAVDDKGAAGPYATGETFTVNSGWVTIGGPAEDMGSKSAPFDFDFTVSVSGAPSVDAITVSATRDGEQVYSGTPSAGEQISVPIDTRLLGAGEHAIEVQASKDDYLPASKRYTFTVPAVAIPEGGVGALAQGPDGRAVYHTTLAQRCIGTGGVDIQAQVDALNARVKTLEG